MVYLQTEGSSEAKIPILLNYIARNARVQVAESLLQACCLAVVKPISGYVRIASAPF